MGKIVLEAFPVLVMIGLIPIVKNDYLLALVYVAIIGVLFRIKLYPKDLTAFIVGFFAMIFFEFIFVSTGVEVFQRNSLLGFMPLWLPLLWGYGFVAMKRSIEILNTL